MPTIWESLNGSSEYGERTSVINRLVLVEGWFGEPHNNSKTCTVGEGSISAQVSAFVLDEMVLYPCWAGFMQGHPFWRLYTISRRVVCLTVLQWEIDGPHWGGFEIYHMKGASFDRGPYQ